MYKRLIPSLLIHKGRLVKGTGFTDYRDAGGPETTARAHNAQGADELAVCDIDASRENKEPDFSTLAKLAEECFMPLTMFGGINTIDRAARCMDIGADKVGLTTAALETPELITDIAYRYGGQAVVIGLDVIKQNDGYKLYDHRTKKITNKDPFEWAKQCVDRGCGEIRLMAVHNEGGLNGFDIDLFARLKPQVNVPIILEGGAGSLEHIEQAYASGVDAVAIGAMLVFSDANLVKIQQYMRSREIAMRN